MRVEEKRERERESENDVRAWDTEIRNEGKRQGQERERNKT